jgi:hypothetical protein
VLTTFDELKSLCDNSKRIKLLSDEKLKQYKKELYRAKIFYENGRDLYDELEKRKDEIQKQYIIPYLLNFTNKLEEGELVYIQAKLGSSGGIDVDSDFGSDGRDKIYNYLVEKYGAEQIIHVGTFSTLGPSSAAKDVLRVYGIDYSESNEFTKILEKEETWEDNIKNIQANHPVQYRFYKKHQEILDLVPDFLNKIRQSGRHAGGIVILPSPVYNYVPVDRVNGEIITAFPESGSEQVLDEIGLVKYDILGISILDVINNAVNMIDEELFLIEDDDGVSKIVPASYIDKEINKL